jgi:tRNA A37 threonylcarbamoyladenosine dehydratase
MLVKHGGLRQASGMTDAKPTREERLAAKLRENLRRRKAQSREVCSRELASEKPTLPKNEPSR